MHSQPRHCTSGPGQVRRLGGRRRRRGVRRARARWPAAPAPISASSTPSTTGKKPEPIWRRRAHAVADAGEPRRPRRWPTSSAPPRRSLVNLFMAATLPSRPATMQPGNNGSPAWASRSNASSWSSATTGAPRRRVPYAQGYLNRDKQRTVRVRIVQDRAWLDRSRAPAPAPRAPSSSTRSRSPTPSSCWRCATARWCASGAASSCTRARTWEIDEFEGDNAGLVVAEIELASEDAPFEPPPWLGAEVTHDARYFNSSLAAAPYFNLAGGARARVTRPRGRARRHSCDDGSSAPPRPSWPPPPATPPAAPAARTRPREPQEHSENGQTTWPPPPTSPAWRCSATSRTSRSACATRKYDKFDIKLVLERLLLKGSIVVKKAYCDWDRYKGFKAAMHEANFELIEIPHVRQSGKNSADIRLVVDALDLCYTKSHVNTFVIISGDSDFSPLVSKLRENNKTGDRRRRQAIDLRPAHRQLRRVHLLRRPRARERPPVQPARGAPGARREPPTGRSPPRTPRKAPPRGSREAPHQGASRSRCRPSRRCTPSAATAARSGRRCSRRPSSAASPISTSRTTASAASAACSRRCRRAGSWRWAATRSPTRSCSAAAARAHRTAPPPARIIPLRRAAPEVLPVTHRVGEPRPSRAAAARARAAAAATRPRAPRLRADADRRSGPGLAALRRRGRGRRGRALRRCGAPVAGRRAP